MHGRHLTDLENCHLLLGVAELAEIVDAVEDGPLVGNRGIEVVLATVLIHADALKHQPLAIHGLQGADLEDGVHMQLCWAHGSEVLLHATPDYGNPVGSQARMPR